MKKALIAGVTGQNGSDPAELLLAKSDSVYGIVRRSSSINTGRIDHISQDLHYSNPHSWLARGDLNLDKTFGRLNIDRKKYVEIDPRRYSPGGFDLQLDDASQAKE